MRPVEIECPVQGMWSFMNPPGHHADAKDMVAVNERGKAYGIPAFAKHLLWTLNVSQVFAWGRPVFAPFDGVIIEVADSREDRTTLNLVRDVISALVLAPRQKPGDVAFFLGNHVIMQSGTGIYALFAHLRNGSIVVKEGERVKTGAMIAAVGNSGNTIQPHLHFHLMEENNPFTATPVPFVFSAYEKKEGREWRTERSALPENRKVFRTIDNA